MSASNLVEDVLRRLEGVRKSGTGWTALCPAHEDSRPSLSIGEGDDGRILIKCFAGCEIEHILQTMELKMCDLFPQGNGRGASRVVATYPYLDEGGKLLFEVVRLDPKGFRQRTPDGIGGWRWTTKGVRRVLYRLPELLAAVGRGETVFVVEGEKDADTLSSLGFPATTNPNGAGKWRQEYTDSLGQADVVVIPDADEPGRKHAVDVANRLLRTADRVRFLELPGAKDATDWFQAGHRPDELRALVEVAEEWNPERPSFASLASCAGRAARWPDPLAPEALHGLAGEILVALRPLTEADDAAILFQLLVAFGGVVGADPHWLVGGTRHALNLFLVLVGVTSKGRKGTSWNMVRELFEKAADGWTAAHVIHGLSSGEGLIWTVRDPIEKRVPIRENKRIVDYDTEVVDPGVVDKRLLVVEQEFARILKVLAREGNTLSPVMRTAFDCGDLRTMTKNSPARATGAHIAIVAHVTRDELRKSLTETEAGNGFANRFLWVCVRRARVLPDGAALPEDLARPLVEKIKERIENAKAVQELRRNHQAAEIWRKLYPELSEGKPGLVGAVLARGEALVMRIAAIYALLDLATEIGPEHLMAALACWDYVEASAACVFGDATGDSTADTILRALRGHPEGLPRTTIGDLFGRHVSSARIADALARLAEWGMARCESVPTAGRPVERWFAA